MKTVLGVALYQGAQKKEFYEEDLKHPDGLYHFLGELYDSESDITEEGYKFLKEYYGLEKVADLLKKQNFGGDSVSKSELIDWLGTLEPFQTVNFINSANERQEVVDDVEQNKEKYKEVYKQLRTVLLEVDLFGLVAGGAPDDEYDVIIPDLYAYAIDDFWDDKNAGENLKRRWGTHFGLEIAIDDYIELFNKARGVIATLENQK